MKILMLSWRDMLHPQKGGAEIVTDIYLSGLSKKGHEVVLFSANYPDAKEEENYNNYKIIRKGNQLSVHFYGLIYAKKNQDSFDIIIDQINTIPFFTPIFIKKSKRIAFFHQLCLNVWFYESNVPISLIGNSLERIYLKLYHNTKSFVVSDSTKCDIVKYCKNKEERILVLSNQIDFCPINKPLNKENYFVFVGRLTKSKRVDHAIKALSLTDNKDSKLYIIGNGNQKYRIYLNKLVDDLYLSKRVIFKGSLSNNERNKLMQKALAILVTSIREGWGLIVTEANANGTMAITYDIEGLRDANKKGIITSKNTPKEMAIEMDKIINDKNEMQKFCKESLDHSKTLNDWNGNVTKLEEWLKI